MKINGDKKFTNQIFIINVAKFVEVIDLWVLTTQQDLYSAASIYGYDSEKLELSHTSCNILSARIPLQRVISCLHLSALIILLYFHSSKEMSHAIRKITLKCFEVDLENV